MHSTNYTNTLILPSEDCRAQAAQPAAKPGTIGAMQMALITENPGVYTSDEVITQVLATRKEIPQEEWHLFRAAYFSKGQACLRASPLVKTLGWAVYHDDKARVSLVDPASERFAALLNDATVTKTQGMRNKRA